MRRADRLYCAQKIKQCQGLHSFMNTLILQSTVMSMPSNRAHFLPVHGNLHEYKNLAWRDWPILSVTLRCASTPPNTRAPWSMYSRRDWRAVLQWKRIPPSSQHPHLTWQISPSSPSWWNVHQASIALIFEPTLRRTQPTISQNLQRIKEYQNRRYRTALDLDSVRTCRIWHTHNGAVRS